VACTARRRLGRRLWPRGRTDLYYCPVSHSIDEVNAADDEQIARRARHGQRADTRPGCDQAALISHAEHAAVAGHRGALRSGRRECREDIDRMGKTVVILDDDLAARHEAKHLRVLLLREPTDAAEGHVAEDAIRRSEEVEVHRWHSRRG
jgi:hypothetical protein